MNDTKYIGMDVHSTTVSMTVLNEAGKLITEAVVKTQADALAEFVSGLSGSLRMSFEEGFHARWLCSDFARLLECSVRARNEVRVSAQLIQVSDQTTNSGRVAGHAINFNHGR